MVGEEDARLAEAVERGHRLGGDVVGAQAVHDNNDELGRGVFRGGAGKGCEEREESCGEAHGTSGSDRGVA